MDMDINLVNNQEQINKDLLAVQATKNSMFSQISANEQLLVDKDVNKVFWTYIMKEYTEDDIAKNPEWKDLNVGTVFESKDRIVNVINSIGNPNARYDCRVIDGRDIGLFMSLLDNDLKSLYSDISLENHKFKMREKIKYLENLKQANVDMENGETNFTIYPAPAAISIWAYDSDWD